MFSGCPFYHRSAELPNFIENTCHFHPVQFVFRYRDPQLEVGENYSDLLKLAEIFSTLNVHMLMKNIQSIDSFAWYLNKGFGHV